MGRTIEECEADAVAEKFPAPGCLLDPRPLKEHRRPGFINGVIMG
jgi:hypothetical protein